MDEALNPYAPGAGVHPPELTGRGPLLEQARVVLARTLAGKPSKSFVAVGLRGVGKTVLLNRVKEMADEAGYRTILAEAHEEKSLPALLVPHLRRVALDLDRFGAVSAQAKRALRVLRGFVSSLKLKKVGEVELGLDIDPERGVADSGDLEADLPDLLTAMGLAAKARAGAVAIILDEIQYLSEAELSALIMALHRVSQEGLPVVLVGAGLPQVVGLTGRSKSYSERLFDFPAVGPLGEEDARRALEEPAQQQGVAFEREAISEILRVTQGYPYFLQEWGYRAWNAAPRSPVTRDDVLAATAEALRRLDASFFRVRFDRLTPREKRYVRGMAELGPGPHRSGDIADKLGIKVQTLAPLRGKLIAKGMVYSPSHGDTAFTVPLFDEFMKRAMPFETGGRR